MYDIDTLIFRFPQHEAMHDNIPKLLNKLDYEFHTIRHESLN